MTQAKTTPIANNTAIVLKKKGHQDSIIDPANQKDVDEVVNSGGTLTVLSYTQQKYHFP
jgi:hypothetical protein